MARHNKYEKYLNDNKPSLTEKIVSTTSTIFGAAALLGGGYYGFRKLHSAGVFDDIKKGFGSDSFANGVSYLRKKVDIADAYLGGVTETIKSSGYKRLLTGKADDELRSNLTESFTKAKMGQIRPVSGDPTSIERVMYSMSEGLSGIGETVATDIRMEKIASSMAGPGITQENLDYLAQFLKKNKRESFLKGAMDPASTSDAAEFNKALSDHGFKLDLGSDGAKSSFQDKLMQVVRANSISSDVRSKQEIVDWYKTNKTEIVKRAEPLKKQFFDSVVDSLGDISNASRVVKRSTGMNLLTVGDALKAEILNTPISFRKVSGSGKPTLNFYGQNPHEMLKKLSTNKDLWDRIKDLYVDPMVFINKQGTVVDMRSAGKVASKTLDVLGSSVQVPFVNIRPFKMLYDAFGLANQNMPMNTRFLSNSVMPTINRSLKELDTDYLYFNGRVVDSRGNLVRNRTYLSSAKFGAWQRSTGAMTGHTSNPRAAAEAVTPSERFMKWLGFGQQDYESDIRRKVSAFTKFKDPDWGWNIWKKLQTTDKIFEKGTQDKEVLDKVNGEIRDIAEKGFRTAYNTVDNNSRALDRDTLELLAPKLKGILSDEAIDGLLHGTRRESTMSALYELLYKSEERREGGRGASLAFNSQIKKFVKEFQRHPETFDRGIRTVRRGQDIFMPDMIESVTPNSTELITRLDEAEKVLHAELLNQIDRRAIRDNAKYTVGDLVNDMVTGGASEDQVNSVKNLNTLKRLQVFAGPDHFSGKPLGSVEKMEQFVAFAKSNEQEKQYLEQIMRSANPTFGYGPGQQYEHIYKRNEYLLMNKAKLDISTPLKQLNESIKQGKNMGESVAEAFGQYKDMFVHQAGFGSKSKRYGRENLDKVTTLTQMNYYFWYRLNEGLSKVNLGLPNADLGSTQDIMKNLFLKRIMAPLGIYYGARYINDELGNVTGEKPTQTASRVYANMTLGVQAVKEVTGLNALGRYITGQFPGLNRIGETPLGIGVKFATFGIIGENRSPEEMRKYYTYGNDPVRKGRFWSVGSSTPSYGDKISYYQPNWYRRQQSDYLMTDVMYGSTGEYWANHWLPNPRNPLGILNPLTWNHWRYKHWEDRPYPTTNSPLDSIPAVGPILDATIGRVMMPFRRRGGLQQAHREYLREINRMYEYYAENSGSYAYMTAGGRVSIVNVDQSQIQAGPEQGAAAQQYGYDYGYASVPGGGGVSVAAPTQDGVRIVDPRLGFAPMQSGRYIAESRAVAMNSSIVSKAYISPARGYSLQSIRDNRLVESLDEAVDPNSLSYRLGKTYYSLTEIGGIYGFATTSMFGDLTPRVQLQSSSSMTGLSRFWWDAEMGGVGGEASEIYRRFLPHRRKNIAEYNPYKNKMPDWMPGVEYFTDFKHGDPYVKIAKGEARLPGAGYEALNRLHPDPIFGKYGALDRYKILADVAPWSEQYRYYKSIVSRMHQDGLISDEDYEQVDMIKEQVKEAKKKYDFHPYKFTYSDIEQRDVTILRMIDETTFITKEFPTNPIRLAAIDMPAQADESSEAVAARAELAKYLKPGAKVKIGINADPLNRVTDDTMNTMSAVVYMPGGDPLNAKMAKKYSNVVKKKDEDYSPVAIHAFYNSSQITLGKVWERFAHMDTPLHTKFLQIRSPLEMYKRKELYGKSWQSWSHPIRDFVQPTLESYWSHNPIVATGLGAGLGWLFGVAGNAKKVTTVAGALIGGLGAAARTFGELTQKTILGDAGYTAIPKRRRKEREIDEYFDMMKYVKYKGLYEKAKWLAYKYEGVNLDFITGQQEARRNMTSATRRKLENAKKWLKINKNHPFADSDEMQQKLDSINAMLNGISADKMLVGAGPYTLRAMQYQQEYESTLYGADPNGDFLNIYRAMPKKDKAFFRDFLLASPNEREEILRLVPKNQRRFYQAKWGLKQDKAPNLVEYFATHNLPGPEWEGWAPDVSIDELKLKFLETHGYEVGEFGYWKDDTAYAKRAPKISSLRGVNPLDVAQLKKVLEGAGLKDADIRIDIEENMPEAPENMYEIAIDVVHDRRDDIRKAINDNLAYILG